MPQPAERDDLLLAQVESRVLQDLQWERVRARALSHCQSAIGARLLAEDCFLADKEAVRHELRLVSDLKELSLSRESLPPLSGLSDLAPLLDRARRQGVLDGVDLIAVADTLSAVHHFRQMILDNFARAPRLPALVEDLPPQEALFEQIYSTFEPDGRVRDDASPRLRELRGRIAALHEQLRTQVAREMRSYDQEALLQDDFFTMREERYVLPVKAQYRGHVPGIVHGSSNTGQSVFIEPESLIALNNRLKMTEQEASQECRLIRLRATELVAEAADEISETEACGARLDSLTARARFSSELGASAPEINASGPLFLREALNPILLLQGKEVIANDIVLGDGFQVLVITGPNTGGKTVTLSTVGLCVLMAQAGYHIPAGADSRLPIYSSLHTSMSDAQSFEHGLSAFSGHVSLFSRILAKAQAQSLVLLDEVMVGTEPSQGSALAVAFLERFAELGATVAVTTHYDRLKTLSLADPRFRNASVGLDTERLAPTYRLATGLPGASSPIAIAARLDVAPAIIERARELVGKETLCLDQVVRELETERVALERARHDFERAREEHEAAAARFRRDGRRLAHEEFSAAIAVARELKKELVAMRRKVKTASMKRKEFEASHKRAAEIEQEARTLAPPDPDAPPPITRRALDFDELVPGRTVWVASFARLGQVEERPSDRRRVSVAMGVMRVKVPADSLLDPVAEDHRPTKRKGAERARNEAAAGPLPSIDYDNMSPPAKVPDNTCDVRGLFRDEAIEVLDQRLDAAAERGAKAVWVVHGHGSGVLKSAIRDYLGTSPYVTHCRSGERSEGGDGVTLAWLE